MAITNFISTIWSENLYEELDKQYIAVANCNREFEGDIASQGATVKICGVGTVTVSDYTKNTNMGAPQALSDTVVELEIDQAKYFNFQIDDIDRAQSNPKLMEGAMRVAASSLADAADLHVYGLFSSAANSVSVSDIGDSNILDAIIAARQKLYENNVNDASEIVLEVTPAIASIILKAKLNLSTDNGEMLEKGCIGSIAGCKIFVSNNVCIDDSDDEYNYHKCFMRTKRAIAFAEQLSEIDAYRPEQRFADAVKGLHLYGAKIVYQKELVVLNLGVTK